jgi:NAD(P)-dependent dehydrogenase (short-subunit alcohol dehydrogenase family)
MASYLITGASRGLGLAMVEILLDQHPENVFQVIATFREENAYLKDLLKKHQNRLFLIHMNVVDEDSIRQAVKQTEEITKGGLDILINNAQVRTSTPEGGITAMYVSVVLA